MQCNPEAQGAWGPLHDSVIGGDNVRVSCEDRSQQRKVDERVVRIAEESAKDEDEWTKDEA